MELGEEVHKSPFPPRTRAISKWDGVDKEGGRATWSGWLRAAEQLAAYVAEATEEGPATGKKHSHSTRRDLDSRRDFDQHHPPSAGVAFAQRVGLAAAVVMAPAGAAGGRFGGNFVLHFERVGGRLGQRTVGGLGRWGSDPLTKRNQQVVRRAVLEYAPCKNMRKQLAR